MRSASAVNVHNTRETKDLFVERGALLDKMEWAICDVAPSFNNNLEFVPAVGFALSGGLNGDEVPRKTKGSQVTGFIVSQENLPCWQIALATDAHPGLALKCFPRPGNFFRPVCSSRPSAPTKPEATHSRRCAATAMLVGWPQLAMQREIDVVNAIPIWLRSHEGELNPSDPLRPILSC